MSWEESHDLANGMYGSQHSSYDLHRFGQRPMTVIRRGLTGRESVRYFSQYLALLFFCAAILQPEWAMAQSDPEVRVSMIDLLSLGGPLGKYTGNGNLVLEDDICVYNSAGSNFKIAFYTDVGSFEMVNGSHRLPFSVRFKVSGGAYQNVTYNLAETFSGAHTTSDSCGGVPNATYEVTLLQSDLLNRRPGAYSASLSIRIQQP
jgi:hypothetical protein